MVCESVVAALRTRSGRESTEPSSSWSHCREGNPSSWYESPSSESLIAHCSAEECDCSSCGKFTSGVHWACPAPAAVACSLRTCLSPLDSASPTGLPNSSDRFRYLVLGKGSDRYRISWFRGKSHGHMIDTTSTISYSGCSSSHMHSIWL